MKIAKPFDSLGLTSLTCLQVFSSIVTGIILVTGADMVPDVPGVFRWLWFVASGLLWALLFAVLVLVSMIKSRHWLFLLLTVVLVAVRIGFLTHLEGQGGGAEDHLYVWFPVEAFVYFIWRYPSPWTQRVCFCCVNLGLHGTQAAAAAWHVGW